MYGYRILRSPRFVSSGCFYRGGRIKLIKMAMNDDRDRTISILILKEICRDGEIISRIIW